MVCPVTSMFFSHTITQCMFYKLHVGPSEHFSSPEICPFRGRQKGIEIQERVLMESFKADPYPGKQQKHHLARSLNVSQKAIQQWFNHMRQKKSKEGVLKKSEYKAHYINALSVYSTNTHCTNARTHASTHTCFFPCHLAVIIRPRRLAVIIRPRQKYRYLICFRSSDLR